MLGAGVVTRSGSHPVDCGGIKTRPGHRLPREMVETEGDVSKQIVGGAIQQRFPRNRNYCWWFRNPKANHLGCIKPVVNNGIL